MRIIRAADCLTMPWKNGGGSTTEIAISPEGASLDDFDWRISMAHVGSDGPFSTFPGIERTLAVLAGSGITLAFGDGGTEQLAPASLPYSFDGERPLEGRLIDGPITDLNVMTRRGRWWHKVTRLAAPEDIALEATSDLLVIVANANGWTLATGTGREHLATGDSVVLDRDERAMLVPERGGEIYVIALTAEVSI